MFKKFLATAAALLLGVGLSFVAVAVPASAHHSDISASATCAPGGSYQITWTVVNSENKTATVVESSLPDVVPVGTEFAKNPNYNKPGSIKVTFTQNVWSKSAQTLKLKLKWSNDATQTSELKFTSFPTSCDRTQENAIDCSAATLVDGRALNNSDHINIDVTRGGSKFQVNIDIDDVQASDGITSASGLLVRVKVDGKQVLVRPVTILERDSGVISVSYGSYISGSYVIEWAQFSGTGRYFNQDRDTAKFLKCGSDVADAAASVTITPATCDAAATLVLGATTHATWGAVTGSYSVTATAADGHAFPADSSAGVTVSADGKTKTFTGTLDPKKNPYSDDCGTLASPVKPDVVEVAKCGVYGSVTPVARDGVAYVVDFDPATGDYTVTATPKEDYYFAGGADDQTVTYKGSVGAYYDCVDTKVSIDVVGVCVYDADGIAGDRTATITYDNTGSTKAILFTGIPGGPTTAVPAGQKVTFDIKVGAAGASYTVTADGKTYPVEIAACPEYTKPKDDIVPVSTEKMICSPDNQVEISTTTTTTSYVFNTTTKTWDAQTPVVTGPVITYRAMTDDEKARNCGFTLDTDPRSSECKVVDSGTDLTSWIYVDTDPRVIYTITNVVTNAVVTPASGYVAVPAGKYTVTAVAAPGYVLNPTAPKVWTDVFVQDTTKCSNTDLGLLTPTATATQPTCTAAGSYTLGGLEGAQFNWTVNGSATTVPNGTYAAPKEGGEIVLVATPVNPTDGLQDWVNPVTLKFSAAPSPVTCGDLPTLAFTGTGVSLQLTLIGALLGLAGVGFFVAGRRLRNGQ